MLWRDINDKYTLIGFVRNATDELIYTSATATRVLLAGAPSVPDPFGVAFPSRIDQSFGLGAPRMYGVELQYKFTKKIELDPLRAAVRKSLFSCTKWFISPRTTTSASPGSNSCGASTA